MLTFCFGQGRIARNAGVAQLVEQLICNQPVGGSSPFTSFFNRGCCESILFFVKLFVLRRMLCRVCCRVILYVSATASVCSGCVNFV